MSERRAAGSGGVRSRGQIPRLGLEPLADVTGAALAISRPSRREAVVYHVIALDAERVSNDPGRLVRVVAVDRLLEWSWYASLTPVHANGFSPICHLTGGGLATV